MRLFCSLVHSRNDQLNKGRVNGGFHLVGRLGGDQIGWKDIFGSRQTRFKSVLPIS